MVSGLGRTVLSHTYRFETTDRKIKLRRPSIGPGSREVTGMEALHAAVKAELGEDGLPMGGRHAEVPAAEHGYGWSVSVMWRSR